jgi:hypothetical protein
VSREEREEEYNNITRGTWKIKRKIKEDANKHKTAVFFLLFFGCFWLFHLWENFFSSFFFFFFFYFPSLFIFIDGRGMSLLHPRPALRKAPGAPAFRENLFF